MKFKINCIEINNFLGYKEAKFTDIKDYNVLIGRNNAGKSNLFRIFNLLINNYNDGKFDKSFLFDCKTDITAEIKITFNLDIDYRRELFEKLYESNHFSNSFHPSHKNVDSSPKKWDEATLNWLIKNEYFKSVAFNFSYQPEHEGIVLKSIIGNNKGSTTRIFDTILKDRQVTLEFLERDGRTGAKSLKEYFERSYAKVEISFHPYYRSLHSFHNNLIKEDYHFSGNISVSNFTPFYKLYNDILFPFFESFHYFPYNRHFERSNDISEIELEIPLPDGTNIGKFIANMKINNPSWLGELNQEIKEFFDNISEFSSMMKSNRTIFHSKERGLNETLHLENLGIGLLNIVSFLINLKYYNKKKSIFLIEEPELFIYPGLQKKVRDKLINYAHENQVFITTHSPSFLTRDFERSSIFHVKKKNNLSVVDNISDENLLDVFKALELSFYDYVLYDGILFVEGPKDIKVFKIIQEELLDKNFKLIPTEGKNNFVHYASANILHFLDNNFFNYLFILDRDRGNEDFFTRIKNDKIRKSVEDRIIPLFTYEIENIFLQPLLLLDFLICNNKIRHRTMDYYWLKKTLENIFQLFGTNNIEYILKKLNDVLYPKLFREEIEQIIEAYSFKAESVDFFDFLYENFNIFMKSKLGFFEDPQLRHQAIFDKLDIIQNKYNDHLKKKEYNLILSGKRVLKKLSNEMINKYKLKNFSLEVLTRHLINFLQDYYDFLKEISSKDEVFVEEMNPWLYKLPTSKFTNYFNNIIELLERITIKTNSKLKIQIRGIENSTMILFLAKRWNLDLSIDEDLDFSTDE